MIFREKERRERFNRHGTQQRGHHNQTAAHRPKTNRGEQRRGDAGLEERSEQKQTGKSHQNCQFR